MEHLNNLPVFSWPTRVLHIDDDLELLKIMGQYLRSMGINICGINDLDKALEYCHQHGDISTHIMHLLSNTDEGDVDHRAIDCNIRNIYKLSDNVEKYSFTPVILLDYQMPSMSGIEFIRLLNKNLKIILLTGVADEYVAINAFNEGLIDFFIKKEDADFYNKLIDQINKLNFKYFNEISDVFRKSIILDRQRPSAIESAEYKNIVTDLIKEKNIIEYYLLSPTGSYYLKDNKQNIYIFNIYSEDEYMSAIENSGDIINKKLNENLILDYFSLNSLNHKSEERNIYNQYKILEFNENKFFYSTSKILDKVKEFG